MDETNFMKVGRHTKANFARHEYFSTARLLHAAITRRMKSRYMVAGKVPGMLVLISSRKAHDDFTEQRIAAAVTDPGIFVREYALWDVKPGYENSKKFKVFAGNSLYPPTILTEDNQREYLAIAKEYEVPVIDVPEEFRRDFEEDVVGAVRDIAGIGIWSVARFIKQPKKVYEAVDETIPVLWTSGTQWVFGLPGELTKSSSIDWGRIDRDAPHVVHIDTSLTSNATGIAMGYISGVKTKHSEQASEQVPVITIDFLLEVLPPVEGEIDLGVIRQVVYDLRDKLGFNIVRVTMDSFQTAEMRQRLKENEFVAELLSIDKQIAPYEMLKSAIYDGRIRFPPNDTLVRELTELVYDPERNKVDHPPEGSKDLSDAVAGVVYGLEENIGIGGEVMLEIMEELRK